MTDQFYKVRQERFALVLRLRENGMRFEDIAKHIGVSPSRAQMIYQTALRVKERKPRWYDGLSYRIVNCLFNYGIHTRDELISAYKSKKLVPGIGGPRNYGKKSHDELGKWIAESEAK